MIVHRSSRGARPQTQGHATRGGGGFRAEVVELHREIFRRNQAQIHASVSEYTPAFRRYERRYAEYVAGYRRRTQIERLESVIARSQVAYVGDYHTLPQAQRAFLRLLRRLPPDRPVTLAMEFVQGRFQRALDAYLRGELSDTAFLDGIRHHIHWVFGGWESFRPIFEWARERNAPVVGIDSVGRGSTGSSLSRRDQYAAKRIAAARRERPDDLVMVLIGELHIAPPHLPTAVLEHLPPNLQDQRDVMIFQNCEELYWQLEARGLEHDTEIVEIASDRYCLMNTPPIVCQQSFLNWLHADDDGLQCDAPEENFKAFIQHITSFFGIDLGDAVDDVEVATVADLSFLRRLQRRGDFSAEDMQIIRDQILSSESYYIPRAKMVYLGNLSINHATEEGTHFIRHVCAQSHEPRLLVDAFYWRVIEEAIGFLGSKIINHKRKAAHVDHFQRLARRKSAEPQERSLARLVLKHAKMEEGRRVRGLAEVYECDIQMYNAVTHVLGYQLGDRLYYGLVSGIIDKDEIRQLFFDPFEEEGEALTTYLYLSQRVRDVRLPERL